MYYLESNLKRLLQKSLPLTNGPEGPLNSKPLSTTSHSFTATAGRGVLLLQRPLNAFSMAEGYESGGGETKRVVPVVRLPVRDSRASSVEFHGKAPAEVEGAGVPDARMAAEAENKPESRQPVDIEFLRDADIADLPFYDEADDNDEKGALATTGKVAGSVVGAVESVGIVKAGRWGAEKSLSLVDRLALKLNSWGDSLLKKADLPFPVGSLAGAAAGAMDWAVSLFASEKSLAELIKKEKEEKKKAMDTTLLKLREDQKKMEKKKDDAEKKKKAKEDKQKKLKKVFGEKRGDALWEAVDDEEKEEDKAEEKEAA